MANSLSSIISLVYGAGLAFALFGGSHKLELQRPDTLGPGVVTISWLHVNLLPTHGTFASIACLDV